MINSVLDRNYCSYKHTTFTFKKLLLFVTALLLSRYNINVKCLMFIKFVDFVIYQHRNFHKTTYKLQVKWKTFMLCCGKFIQDITLRILSESAEFCFFVEDVTKHFGLLFHWTRCAYDLMFRVTCSALG